MAKMNRRLDGITSFRSRTPTNEQTASNFTNMVFDFSRQKDLIPDRKSTVLMEATNGTTRRYRPMNKSGKPMALGLDGVGGSRVNLGGAPDYPGTRKF
jgi:hypothetical protein